MSLHTQIKTWPNLPFLIVIAFIGTFVYWNLFVSQTRSEKLSVSITNQLHNKNYDAHSVLNEPAAECYVYMMPTPFKGYFHFWDTFFASLRISAWNFTCNNTVVYVPPRNRRRPEYIDMVKDVFGEFSVLTVDELNAYTIDETLSAMSSYFNHETLQITNYNHTRIVFHPLHRKIVSSNISLNYTKYGAFGQGIQFVFTQNATRSSIPHGRLFNREIHKYSYLRSDDKSQEWLHGWRLYMINNTLQLNANDYDLDYYANHGYISIVNRKHSSRRHISDKDILWLNETLVHLNWSHTRVVYYETLSWKEQLKIALESTIIITPHGAGEVNSLMMHPSYSFHLEVCPFYSHCMGLCPRLYKDALNSYNIQGFGSEIQNVNCSEFYERTNECEGFPGTNPYWRARDNTIDLSAPMIRSQIVQSIVSHLMHLTHLNDNNAIKSFSEYRLRLRSQPCEVSVDRNISWEPFIAQYC